MRRIAKSRPGTKSASVLVHMLVRRILNLRWDVNECNKALEAYIYAWKLCQEHQLQTMFFINKALESFDEDYHYVKKYECDLKLLKDLSIFSLTKIPVLDLNSRLNLDKTLEIYKLRWNIIVDVSFASKVMSRELMSVKNFNKVFSNPNFNDSLITRAWHQIVVAEIHNF